MLRVPASSLLGAHARVARHTKEGAVMRTVETWITLLLPIAIAAGGCSTRKEGRVVAPSPPGDPPAVASARWVWDRAALGAAVARASSSPLVERALREAEDPGLPFVADGAVRAEGALDTGASASVTILPYARAEDATHATFVSYMRRGDDVLVERAELIVGRAPFDDEPGYVPIGTGPRTIWVRSDATYAAAPDGAAALAPERINWSKFLQCFANTAQTFSDAGASIATQIAPMYPAAAAVGGAIGTAIAALSCAIAAWQ
ncbi:MAG: hypothetical protein ACM3JJ_11425 [Hyphomicrobiales bacterium]